MRIRTTIFLPATPPNSREEFDVEIRADARTRFVEIAPALAELCGVDERTAFFIDERQLIGSERIGEPPLISGARIAVRRALPRRPPRGNPALRVVGGPDAGHEFRLPQGTTGIGRGATAAARIVDGDLSRRHATITVAGDTVTLTDERSTNGVFVDGVRVRSSTAITSDHLIKAGASYLDVSTGPAQRAQAKPDDTGRIHVSRPPRIEAVNQPAVLRYPTEPTAPHRATLPWLLTLAPLAGGAALYTLGVSSPVFLLVMAMTPILMVANALFERRAGRRAFRTKQRKYRREVAALDQQLTQLLAAEATARRSELLDPATAIAATLGPTVDLWRSRGPHLRLRLGLGTVAARLSVVKGDTVNSNDASHPDVADVPVIADLSSLGVVGVCAAEPAGVIRWLVTQLATAYSPTDVRIAVFAAEHSYARWFPHRGSARETFYDASARHRGVSEIVDLIATRGVDPTAVPVVVVVDSTELSPGQLAPIVTDGPAAGVFTICVAPDEISLPGASRAVITVDEHGTGRLVAHGSAHAVEYVADQLAPKLADRAARALAPLTDAGQTGTAALPVTVDLAELLAGTSADDIATRWRQRPSLTRVPIGVGAAGPVHIDIAADGPHALIAGSTGSGKSELLRSLVVSLASANSPEMMTFVLVDYKGGSAFAACAELPHTVGMVTDLDKTLTSRALASLKAELRRREHLLAAVGADDIAAYHRSDGEVSLPRLVLVVDEFATLADELPEFLQGLVDVARRGRSLGVHLVLATQRPRGVISPEIRANTSLRIALRVTDKAESVDVIDEPDAALIPAAARGRAVARLANGLIEFHTARVGAVESGQISVRRWGSSVSAPSDGGAALVAEIAAAAKLAEVTTPPTPWLPPLPTHVELSSLPAPAPAMMTVGLLDEPDRQRQSSLTLPVRGTVAVFGQPRSGRSTALRTAAISATTAAAPSDLRLFVVDCGDGALADLAELPHCAAYATSADIDHLVAVTQAVDAALADALSGDGSDRHCLVLLDSWEGLRDALGDINHPVTDSWLPRLVRRGPAAGVGVVISGDRPLLNSPVGRSIATRLVLPQADADAYLAAGVRSSEVGADRIAGRAVVVGHGDRTLTAHIAVAEVANVQWPDAVAVAKLRPLPISARLPGVVRDGWWTPIGVANTATGQEPIGVDVGVDGSFLIVGPRRSGRSTALAQLTAYHVGARRAVAVVAPLPSPLSSVTGVVSVASDDPAGLAAVVDSGGLVVVDDVEKLLDTPVEATLRELVAKRRVVMVAAASVQEAGSAYRGLLPELRRARAGVLLRPRRNDGDVFGVRIAEQRATWPGRGLLVMHDEVTPVQIFTS